MSAPSSLLSPAPARENRPTSLLLLVLLIVLVGSELTNISQTRHPRFTTRSDCVDSQLAILERRPFSFDGHRVDFTSWRSRILVPHAIKLLSDHGHMTFSQAYGLVRWGTAVFALGAFALLVARTVTRDPVKLGFSVLGLAGVLTPTFLHIYEIPSDFPDVGFIALLLLFSLEKKRGPFALTLMIALFNRESALFALIFWFGLHGWPLKGRSTLTEIGFCGGLGLAGVAMTIWLRKLYEIPGDISLGGQPEFLLQPLGSIETLWPNLRNFMTHPHWGSPMFFLIGMLVLFTGIFWANWSRLSQPIKTIVAVAAAVFVVSIPLANLPELRVYIPSLVMAVFGVTTLLAPGTQSGQKV